MGCCAASTSAGVAVNASLPHEAALHNAEGAAAAVAAALATQGLKKCSDDEGLKRARFLQRAATTARHAQRQTQSSIKVQKVVIVSADELITGDDCLKEYDSMNCTPVSMKPDDVCSMAHPPDYLMTVAHRRRLDHFLMKVRDDPAGFERGVAHARGPLADW
eukprot:CAMPEP_0178411114 /NCGR_PEP_ID=MMETSP0689_2-20121128/21329_1 /TAXON_ID=160604 /ORGANISM="Amphidinium massartii, Strain CS-259" /LENGTH=161 /DNA_ID=CAMNT_0020032313 /DNA_START=237 /DNA_END=719 /DNA_ORIENTATION=+